MTDEETLQRALDEAEVGVQALEAQLASATELRHGLSKESLDALEARREELSRALRALGSQEQALNDELAHLELKLRRPGVELPPRVATPLAWFLRSAVFTIFAGSVVAAHRFIQSAGLVVALVLGLPIAFVLVMVAGSLRESGAADKARSGAGQGEEPAGLPAIDERVGAPSGGPDDDRHADLAPERSREGTGDRR